MVVSVSVTGDLSIPALLYVRGERIAPADSDPQAGVTIPCGSARVTRVELAAALLASAAWSLRERGLVELDAGGAIRPSGQGDAPGIEGELLSAGRPGGPIATAVDRWLGTTAELPARAVLVRVRDELLGAGLAHRDPPPRRSPLGRVARGVGRVVGGVADFLDADPTDIVADTLTDGGEASPAAAVRIDCEAVTRIAEVSSAAVERWLHFAATEPGLYGALLAGALGALNRPTASS